APVRRRLRCLYPGTGPLREVSPMSRPDPRVLDSQIQRLTGDAPADCPDGELLERFRIRSDQAAFAALVRRHAPLVWCVCRRGVGDGHAAEDAFRAACPFLARRPASIRRAESLGAWLHSVARQLALRARRGRARRHEAEAGRAGEAATVAAGEPAEELSLR